MGRIKKGDRDFVKRAVYTNLNLRTSSDINEVSEIARAPKII